MTPDRSQSRLIVPLMLLLAGLARAQGGWVLTRADFSAERVDLLSMDANSANIRSISGETRVLPLDDLLMLERATRSTGTTGGTRFLAVLTGGGRAAGTPKNINGDNLVWANPTLGEVTLPLRSVQCIVRSGAAIPNPTPQTEDAITLSNGDSVRGILAGISDAGVTIQQAGGEATSVPFDSIERIAFATTAVEPIRRENGYRVGLADGSVIAVATLALDERQVIVVLADGSKRPVPMQTVVSIEHVNGPVIWLSALVPIESVHTPFLGLAWPARMDRAVDGEPLRFGSRTFDHGIGVHSYSRLVFPIEPGMSAFRTQYAIAGDLPYASVSVRIKLDDRIVHEAPNVRSGSLAPPVLVPLDGARTLTLEVDYGQGYDVQDRFNWIEPALLKKLPTPPN